VGVDRGLLAGSQQVGLQLDVGALALLGRIRLDAANVEEVVAAAQEDARALDGGKLAETGTASRTFWNRPSSSLSCVWPTYASRRMGTNSSRESSLRMGANRSARARASASGTADWRGISPRIGPCSRTKLMKKMPAMTIPSTFRTSSAPRVART
jgi:hypothetical protein